MRRFSLRTLFIVLAIGPLVMDDVACSTRKDPPPEFYDRFRVPFPPEVRRVVDEPDRLTLFSIEPDDEGTREFLPDVTEHDFHGYKIFGKAEITDAQQRKSLIKSLDEGISKATHGPTLSFWPRHGISVVRGDTRFDLIISFDCSQIHVLDVNAKSIFKTQTTDEPAAVFKEALASASVPLATPPSR